MSMLNFIARRIPARFFKGSCGLLFTIVFMLNTIPAFSQDDDSTSVTESIASFFGANQPKFGMLVQLKAFAYNEGSKMVLAGTGERFYLSAKGDITKKFRYFTMFSVLDEFRLLDLKFTYDFKEYLGFDFGRLKTPFGREYAKSIADLLFVRQSLMASQMGPQRQDGVQLHGRILDQRLNYAFGVFGGEGIRVSSRTGSLYAGRVFGIPLKFQDGEVEIGASLAYSNDQNDFFDQQNIYIFYPGTARKYWGADVHATYSGYSLTGEYLTLRGSPAGEPEGFYVDCSKEMVDDIEAAVRFDYLSYQYKPENYSPSDETYRYYMAGVNWYPEKEVKLQLNYSREPYRNYTTVTLQFQFALNQGK